MKSIYVLKKRPLLAAVEELLRGYNGNGEFHICPLCFLSSLDCAQCPWRWLEGTDCATYAFIKFHQSYRFLKSSHNSAWYADSIARLNRWKRIIEEL